MAETSGTSLAHRTGSSHLAEVRPCDWTSVVRDPLDVYRIAFIAAVVVWGILGHSVA